MSDRSNYFSGQRVTEGDLEETLTDVENADRTLQTDHGRYGVIFGFELTATGPASMQLNTAGPASAYDKQGRRIHAPINDVADLSEDDDEISTQVTSGPGFERWLSLFVRFARLNLQARGPDLANNTVLYRSEEYYEFYCVAGAEAATGTAMRPSLSSTDILLCDVLIDNTTTAITNGDIDTTRTEYLANYPDPGTGFEIVGGNELEAIGSLFNKMNDLIDGTQQIPASGVEFTGTAPVWATAANVSNTADPNDNVEQYLENIVGDLAAIGATTANGVARIGGGAFTVGAVTISAGTLRSQLTAMADATGINIVAGPIWADGSTNLQQSLNDRINHATTGIIARLASRTDATTNGTRYIGVNPSLPLMGGSTRLDEILIKLTASTSGTDNGLKRIGFFPTSELAATDAYAAVLELATEWGRLARANTWTANQTFQGGVTVDSTAALNGPVVVGDTADFNGVSTFNASAIFNDPSAFNDNLDLNGTTLRTGLMTISGSGATTAWRATAIDGSQSAVTLSVTADTWYVDNPTVGAAITYTLKSTSPAPPANSRLTVAAYALTVGETVAIQREGGALIVQFNGVPGGAYGAAEFQFLAGSWRLLTVSSSNTITYGAP